jgi:hypothetical protein
MMLNAERCSVLPSSTVLLAVLQHLVMEAAHVTEGGGEGWNIQHTITCDTIVKIVHRDEAPVLLVQGDVLLAVLQHLVMEAAHVTEGRGRGGTYNIHYL